MENQLVEPELIDIDAELKRATLAAEGKQSVRASLFTLILYVNEGSRAEHFKNLIEKVIAKFPCRVITITATQTSGLKTGVTITSIGSSNIYCEQISLSFSKEFANRVPFLVVPHLLSDLPVHLLWTEDPQKENALFQDLAKWSTRILFDANCTHNLCGFGQSVLHLFQKGHDVRDLDWSLLSSWRHVLAQTFHDERALKTLKEASEIKITAHEDGVEALYLHTWLAALFKWEVQKKEDHITLYKTNRGELAVIHIPNKELCIQEMEVSQQTEGTHYQLTLEKGGNVRVLFSDREQCNLPVFDRLLLTKEEDALTREFFYPSSQLHYLLMLQKL
jgi:glucose-6-phosphate dehydrogenase assembly protein OpcA